MRESDIDEAIERIEKLNNGGLWNKIKTCGGIAEVHNFLQEDLALLLAELKIARMQIDCFQRQLHYQEEKYVDRLRYLEKRNMMLTEELCHFDLVKPRVIEINVPNISTDELKEILAKYE